MKAKFEVKENVQLVFKKKKNVPFASLKQINDELADSKNWVFYQKLKTAIGLHQQYI